MLQVVSMLQIGCLSSCNRCEYVALVFLACCRCCVWMLRKSSSCCKLVFWMFHHFSGACALIVLQKYHPFFKCCRWVFEYFSAGLNLCSKCCIHYVPIIASWCCELIYQVLHIWISMVQYWSSGLPTATARGHITQSARSRGVCGWWWGGHDQGAGAFAFLLGSAFPFFRARRSSDPFWLDGCAGVPPDVQALEHPIQNCVTYSRKEDAHVWWWLEK
jgi:hypothetical protein